MIPIYLTQSRFCIIDDVDADRVMRYRWHLHIDKNINSLYARTNIGGFKVNLGRFLLNLGNSDLTCDHKNGQTLDYRRCNLRKVSLQQNLKSRDFRHKRNILIPTLEEILSLENFDIPFIGENYAKEKATCTSFAV